MIFYQQSATVDKRLKPGDLVHARWDTGIGAILTQCLTGAVLVAAAAAFATGSPTASLTSVGEISRALTPVLGESAGRLVFGAGVLGASLVAAIVSSLALAWGVGEVAGYRRSLEYRPFEAGWFYAVYAAGVIGSCAVVWLRLEPGLAQYRRPSPQRLPDAARHRLSGRAGGQGAAGAVPAQGWYLGLDRRRFCARVRGRRIRGPAGVDVRRGAL